PAGGFPWTAGHGRSTPAAFALLQVETNVLPASTESAALTLVSPCRSAKKRLPELSLTMLLSPPPAHASAGLPSGGASSPIRWKVCPPSSDFQMKLAVVENPNGAET